MDMAHTYNLLRLGDSEDGRCRVDLYLMLEGQVAVVVFGHVGISK